MSESHRRDDGSFGRLKNALITMIAVGIIVAFVQSTAAIFPRRDALSERVERSCTLDNQLACQEMYATIRAANAADDIVDLAIWQFIAGLLGVYLIARTLQASRDAVAEANAATAAARRSVEIAQSTLQNDRAWMIWTGVETMPLDGGGMMFWASWENTGRSPALDLKCFIWLDFIPPGVQMVTKPIPPHPAGRSGPVGAGKTTLTDRLLIDPARAEAFKFGRLDILMSTEVSYRDIFVDDVRQSTVQARIKCTGRTKDIETGKEGVMIHADFMGGETKNT